MYHPNTRGPDVLRQERGVQPNKGKGKLLVRGYYAMAGVEARYWVPAKDCVWGAYDRNTLPAVFRKGILPPLL